MLQLKLNVFSTMAFQIKSKYQKALPKKILQNFI